MRARWILLVVAGCGFRSTTGSVDGAGAADAELDGPGTRALCSTDPQLRMCFSFDQSPLPATLPNEGAATASADLTNVVREARGSGGAAMIGTSSKIFVPMTPQIAGIRSIEMWVRVDAPPAATMRMGLTDTDGPPEMSLFYLNETATRQLRCEIGPQFLFADFTAQLGTWVYVACTCEGTRLTAYVDGVEIGFNSGNCAPGAIAGVGLMIGQNNEGAGNANDWLVGAIDGIRMWTTALSSGTICEAAGRDGC